MLGKDKVVIEITDGLNPKEEATLRRLLAKCGEGELSDAVFTQLADIIPQPIVELVLLRWNESTLETLVIPRPKDDIIWPGQYHTPGTVLRRSDFGNEYKTPLDYAFERIAEEIGFEFSQTDYVMTVDRLTKRGPEVARIFTTTTLPGQMLKSTHRWYPVKGLKNHPNFMQSQLGHIEVAVKQFVDKNHGF